jgi:rhodanese-related sulfurtransferase
MQLMKNLFIIIGLCLGMAAPALADAPMQIKGAKTIEAAQIVDLIGKTPNLIIIDARIPEEYKEASIQGAVNIVNTDVTPATMAKAVPSKSTPVLIYCNGLKCGRAADAVTKAVSFGYTDIYYYALGMTEWKEKNMPVVKHE